MTNRMLGRIALVSNYLSHFVSGPKTLKQLQDVQLHPEATINILVKQGYVVKVKRGLYKWAKPINMDSIQAIANAIAKNWNKRNVYVSSIPITKALKDYSTSELVQELARRNFQIPIKSLSL